MAWARRQEERTFNTEAYRHQSSRFAQGNGRKERHPHRHGLTATTRLDRKPTLRLSVDGRSLTAGQCGALARTSGLTTTVVELNASNDHQADSSRNTGATHHGVRATRCVAWLLHCRYRLGFDSRHDTCRKVSTDVDILIPSQYAAHQVIATPGFCRVRFTFERLERSPQLEIVTLIVHQGRKRLSCNLTHSLHPHLSKAPYLATMFPAFPTAPNRNADSPFAVFIYVTANASDAIKARQFLSHAQNPSKKLLRNGFSSPGGRHQRLNMLIHGFTCPEDS